LKMKNLRTIKKNAKALSPVVASIILIAVTVAVSVVVAAWMGGMTTGLMGSAEQVQITNIGFTGATNQISVTVQNTGDGAITLKNAFVNGADITSGWTSSQGNFTLTKGNTMTVTLVGTTLAPGTQYQVKLVTAKGTGVVNVATYNNPS
jgi:archaeal type IV pilus assembly protein PilA